MKKLSKKSMKSIGIFAMCIMLLCAMSLNTFAYQADFVKKENHFGDRNVFYGRLYVMNCDDYYYPHEGSAETYVTTYSNKITEILVQYWFIGNTLGYNDTVKQVIAKPGNKSTQTYNDTITAYYINSFHGLHKVKYDGYEEHEQWWDYTIEEGVFI